MNDASTLFTGTAQYYSQYRRGYAPELYTEIIQKAQLSRESIILDIGTGTGTIAHTLAPMVKQIYAIDPSRDMLKEAGRTARERSLNNIVFIKDIAENIDTYTKLEYIDLVTFGASLHWVKDTDVMFAKVADVLKPGGWLAIISGAIVRIWTEDQRQGWKYDVTNIIKKYLGEERRAGEGLFKEKVSDKVTFEGKLCAHPDIFTNLQTIEVQYTRIWTPELVLGFLYSTSYARRDYFGDTIESFERDVRDLFKERSMKEWQENERHVALMAQKPIAK